jgi:DNA mismatch repair protein MutS
MLQQQFSDSFFEITINLLKIVDFHLACSKNAYKHSLSKPCIVTTNITHENDDCYSSFVDIGEVRHVIVEHVQHDIAYTPNSVCIGKCSNSKNNGVVLYGVNASGKSSLMKSIGIAIILAQSGMYVPCKYMNYRPYTYIFTRIQSSDNILKGMSTFSNEISELRNIFKRASNTSLVIGDELCSGTESISALSIVTAGIDTLVKLNTSFIFATHLHELTRIPILIKLVANNNVVIKHLSVEFDEKNGTLVYDRCLKDGPGSSVYGIEVCKAMGMCAEFVHLASSIRNDILHSRNEIIQSKV